MNHTRRRRKLQFVFLILSLSIVTWSFAADDFEVGPDGKPGKPGISGNPPTAGGDGGDGGSANANAGGAVPNDDPSNTANATGGNGGDGGHGGDGAGPGQSGADGGNGGDGGDARRCPAATNHDEIPLYQRARRPAAATAGMAGTRAVEKVDLVFKEMAAMAAMRWCRRVPQATLLLFKWMLLQSAVPVGLESTAATGEMPGLPDLLAVHPSPEVPYSSKPRFSRREWRTGPAGPGCGRRRYAF